jgi:UV DNA damage endonuclease
MSEPKSLQLGLCCMNTELRGLKKPVYCSRRIIIRIINEKGIQELKHRILLNLEDLYQMLIWNEENGIRVFRLSSEMFQHKTNPKVPDYTFDFAIHHLKIIGNYAKEKGHRLTFHPGQYNQLAAINEKVLQQTIKDLEYHADVLDLMELDQNSVMVIHGGGVYGDKELTKTTWCENYSILPEKIKSRLVLENCEHSYSIKDVLDMNELCDVPIVFDTHHHECYKKLHPQEKFEDTEYYIPKILNTWKKKGIKPKFHVSEQGRGKTGHHSDYVETIPNYLLEIPEKYGIEIDIMIEAKAKEQSIKHLYKKYPFLNCKITEKE